MTSRLLVLLSLCAIPTLIAGQNSVALDPKLLLEPRSDSWPVYSGDYSGKRFSALTQVNRSTVKHLTLAWRTRVNGVAGGGGRGGRAGGGGPTIVGGVGTIAYDRAPLRGSILQVNGILYV